MNNFKLNFVMIGHEAIKERKIYEKDENGKRIKDAKPIGVTPLLDNGNDQTFGEFLQWWFSKYKKPKLKASTLRSMDSYVKRISVLPIGDVPLTKLDGETLQSYLGAIEQGNTCSLDKRSNHLRIVQYLLIIEKYIRA